METDEGCTFSRVVRGVVEFKIHCHFVILEIMDPRIDVAFELLEKATLFEKDGSNRIEAATKVSIQTLFSTYFLEFSLSNQSFESMLVL